MVRRGLPLLECWCQSWASWAPAMLFHHLQQLPEVERRASPLEHLKQLKPQLRRRIHWPSCRHVAAGVEVVVLIHWYRILATWWLRNCGGKGKIILGEILKVSILSWLVVPSSWYKNLCISSYPKTICPHVIYTNSKIENTVTLGTYINSGEQAKKLAVRPENPSKFGAQIKEKEYILVWNWRMYVLIYL